MTLEMTRDIQRVVSGNKISRYIILGGEPTLHEQLPEIIKGLSPAKVVLVTNAVKLSEIDYLRTLRDQGLSIVTVSLKGATEQQYKENTGVACLGYVEKAISNLNELKMPYSISVTLSNSVMNNLPNIITWMGGAKANTMSINYCRPVISGNNTGTDGMPNPREMTAHTIKCYDLVKKSGVRCVFNFMLPLCLLPFEFISELIKQELLTTVCQLQKGNGLIFMPDGSLIPCNHLFEYKLGKLGEDFRSEGEFQDFLKKKEIIDFYQKTGGLPDERCRQCSLKSRCGGGCFIQYLHYNPADIIGQPFERKIV